MFKRKNIIIIIAIIFLLILGSTTVFAGVKPPKEFRDYNVSDVILNQDQNATKDLYYILNEVFSNLYLFLFPVLIIADICVGIHINLRIINRKNNSNKKVLWWIILHLNVAIWLISIVFLIFWTMFAFETFL